MKSVIFWFRNDLRLHDQPALRTACAADAQYLLPVFCLPDNGETSPWGFARSGPNRQAWLEGALHDLGSHLSHLGCPLLISRAPAAATLPLLVRALGAEAVVVCEDIAAPQERAEVDALRAAGLCVQTVWQSSLLEPAELPWRPDALPPTFTAFRKAIEQAELRPPEPLPPPSILPPWPPDFDGQPHLFKMSTAFASAHRPVDPRSSLPHGRLGLDGGETAGLAHLAQYLERKLPVTYKNTRNGLTGVDYSSKWSPWLANGALSARHILAELRQFEQIHGVSEGSYWLWFELLWRDYFRFLHLQHGNRLYQATGLSRQPNPPHKDQEFQRWCHATTGEPLVDAAMRELLVTGYLSNRLRQMAASYLVHDLGGDWRAGAAWFESQLVDYDVHSNQGNWLYIAGRDTDPRGGRRFNATRQSAEHDPAGTYRQLWSTI